jgi:hypothetical protein
LPGNRFGRDCDAFSPVKWLLQGSVLYSSAARYSWLVWKVEPNLAWDDLKQHSCPCDNPGKPVYSNSTRQLRNKKTRFMAHITILPMDTIGVIKP